MMSGKHGGKRAGAGRKHKPLSERSTDRGKISIRIDLDTAALAQRLMLHFPQVATVEALFAYALRKLAETTDDKSHSCDIAARTSPSNPLTNTVYRV